MMLSREERWSGENAKGFSLIELMVALLIAMIILAGLFATFIKQSSEFKYQGKRVDAVQDLEFAIKFVGSDLRSSLMQTLASVAFSPQTTTAATTTLSFQVWDISIGATSKRATRGYSYDSVKQTLSYDRDLSVVGYTPILSNVTYFKVFNDSVTDNSDGRSSFLDIPGRLPNTTLTFEDGSKMTNVPGFTILVEMQVDAGYKEGRFIDSRGTNVGFTGKKRIWRYIQIYPQVAAQ